MSLAVVFIPPEAQDVPLHLRVADIDQYVVCFTPDQYKEMQDRMFTRDDVEWIEPDED
jgi:hypothetical protein